MPIKLCCYVLVIIVQHSPDGHTLALMCAKNHLLIFSSFLDIWENVEWPRFFWTNLYFGCSMTKRCAIMFGADSEKCVLKMKYTGIDIFPSCLLSTACYICILLKCLK